MLAGFAALLGAAAVRRIANATVYIINMVLMPPSS